jgi:hypothetical protein
VVVELKTVMAVDVALPLRVEIAEYGSKIAVVDAGVKVRDDPAPDRSATVANLIGEPHGHALPLVQEERYVGRPSTKQFSYNITIQNRLLKVYWLS